MTQAPSGEGIRMIRQAIHSGEGFGAIAELAGEAYRRECELRAAWGDA